MYTHTCSHTRVPSSSLIKHVCLHVHNVHVNSHSQVVFNWVLVHARKSVRHRENMRFSRSKLFGIYRELFRAIGGSLVALGLLEHRQVHSVLYIVCLQSVSTSLAPIQCGHSTHGKTFFQLALKLRMRRFSSYYRFLLLAHDDCLVFYTLSLTG